jgi:acyl-coenzyme A synthetase/AMP-(fatty) acid ligase
MSSDYETPMEEWLGVLALLWTAVGKPIEAERLKVYQQALESVPLGLLEQAVKRVIRENDYQVVPMPGMIWAAVKKELGNPIDVEEAIENWLEGKWYMMINKYIKQPARPDPIIACFGREGVGSTPS